jgi:hypothetical protein
MAHSAKAIMQTIVVFVGVAYIALRMTFKGSANPPAWCAFSEMVTDLATEIALSPDYDPAMTKAPGFEAPAFKELLDATPFGRAKEMVVTIPTTLSSRHNCFIDDMSQIFLDTPNNRRRMPGIVPLAVFATCRPHAGEDKPIIRRQLLSPSKLVAEGTPAEIQIVLGWELNTRSLVLMLPGDKFTAWTQDIVDALSSGTILFGDLESLVGRLNHSAYVIPLARHFINRLRKRIDRRHPKSQQFTLTTAELLEDLVLWMQLLRKANDGLSLNRIVRRQPTRIKFSDSCPYGMGGFLLSERAWRLRIPPASPLFGNLTANNVLEFLALAVTLWLQVLEATEPEECILSLADNTSALGWIYRSGKVTTDFWYFEAMNAIAHKIASVLIDSSHCLASQHLKGDYNDVAALLSFGPERGGKKEHPLAADDPLNDVLTQRFNTFLPQLTPQGFRISPLPSEILSFVTQVLLTAESSLTRKLNKPMRNETESGAVGSISATPVDSGITPTSLEYPQTDPSFSAAPSYPFIGSPIGTAPESLLGNVRDQWSATLSELPQATWLRRFGTVSNKAPFTSRTAPSFSPRSDPSCGPSIMLTPRQTVSGPSPPSSSVASS